ncbi:MAG: glycosyltransferase 87 family protein [Candidatus Roizmanbacteria bacterium]|nr:glycosyltransferase 87 family protein [Candidatus Roizmanbacteria bacterium]
MFTLLSSVDFDEGYFLQVVWHLWHHGSYRSFYQLFDPYITTGPTVLIPASLFVPLHPLAPRIVTILYLIGLIYITYHYYINSIRLLVIWILLIIALPHSYLYLTHVLGELPALFFIVAGYGACARRKELLGGLLIGLAILTKQISILAVIPLLFTRRWSAVGIAVIPAALWHLIGILLGSGSDSGIVRALAWPRPDMLHLRLSMMSSELGVHAWICLLAGYGVWTYGAQYKKLQLLSIFCWTYATYYLLLYSNYSYRTLFPLLVATLLVGVALIPRRLVMFAFIMALLALCIRPMEIEPITYAGQATFAHFIKTLPGSIAGCGWQSAPELSYLAQRRIDREVTKSTRYYITTRRVLDCALPPFPAKQMRCNSQHCVYQKL